MATPRIDTADFGPTAFTTLDSELRSGSHKVALVELLRHDDTGVKLRVHVDVDTSYAFQSWATIETLTTGMVWNKLASIHFSNMESRPGPTPSRDNFAADRNALLGLFLKLID